MRQLTLLRHAKSDWHNNLADVDRPLNKRGRRDAPTMAARLRARGLQPDRLHCSSAARTRETADMFLQGLELTKAHARFHDELYLASEERLAAFIETHAADDQHIIVLGHNPGLENLSVHLDGKAPDVMPTCSMSHFVWDGEHHLWNFEWFDYPKNGA